MSQINAIDETLMSICAETQGRFELDPESGEPNEHFACARLTLAWCASSPLSMAEDKGALSMEFLYRLVYPNTPVGKAINKMQPDCLKLATIIKNTNTKPHICG